MKLLRKKIHISSKKAFKWIKLFIIFIPLFCLIFTPQLLLSQTKITPKIYKVAILPFLIHSQENLDYLREGIYDILSSRISVEGRIIVIDRSLIERALYEERPMRLDENVAKNIGMRVDADYVVLGSLTKIGNYISLDARLLSVTEEKPPLGVFTQHKGLDDVMVKIGDFAQEIGYKILGRRIMTGKAPKERGAIIVQPRAGIERIGAQGPDFKKSQTFPFEIKGLDIGDVDGDGKNEVVIMDYHNLYVFKYDGEKLTLFRKIETGYHYNFLTLDVSDVNRNGFSEIIVTSVVEDDLRSFIIEFEEGKFRKITEKAGWFFRVVKHPKEGPTLLGQRMGSEGIPSGPIYKFVWKKNSFEREKKIPLPRDIKNIFGFTVGNVRTQDVSDIVMLDTHDRLWIISQDAKFSWQSKEQYGGTNNSYDTKKVIDPLIKDRYIPDYRVYIPGRVITKDLDGDGIEEIIINKNYSSTRLFDRIRNFESGEIYNLYWYDNMLETNWKTRQLEGYISDFQIADVDNDGEEELVVATVGSSGVGLVGGKENKSNIVFFKLF